MQTSHGGAEQVKAPYVTLAIVIMGVFMSILDTSVVNIAIPTMQSAFNASTNQIQWVLTGYMLTLGVLIPISGWMTDKFGAKHLFLASLLVFTIGSALCGMAWNTSSIIVFRIVQALGGGFMMPVAQAVIFRMFPPERRGFVMGLFGISIMAAPAFGPALSGYIVEYSSWRLIFDINIPFGLLAFIMGLFAMHEFEHHPHAKLDFWGFGLSTVGFFSLLYGLNEVPQDGWGSITVTAFISVGVVSLILLVIVELIVPNPVIQLRVFKDYMFTMSTLIGSITNVALFAGIFLLPLYLQEVVGLSAIRTGLLMTPAALASAVMMPISGRLFDKIGARPLGLVGLTIIAITTIGFTHLGRNTSVVYIQWLYILRSVGMGMTMMPIMTAGMNTVPRQWLNQGSGVSNTARQVAASLGTALLTSVLTERSRFHFDILSRQVTPFTPQGQTLIAMQHAFAAQGKPASLATNMYAGLLHAVGFVEGLNDTFWVAFGLTMLALVLTLFFASKKEAEIRLGHKRKAGAGSGGASGAMVAGSDASGSGGAGGSGGEARPAMPLME